MEKGAEWNRYPTQHVRFLFWVDNDTAFTQVANSTGLPLSTYFSAIKLRWMIDNYPEVGTAHESDELLFGTIESWISYVCDLFPPIHTISFLSSKPFRIYLGAFRKVSISLKLQMPLALCCSIPLRWNGSRPSLNSLVFETQSCPSSYLHLKSMVKSPTGRLSACQSVALWATNRQPS